MDGWMMTYFWIYFAAGLVVGGIALWDINNNTESHYDEIEFQWLRSSRSLSMAFLFLTALLWPIILLSLPFGFDNESH